MTDNTETKSLLETLHGEFLSKGGKTPDAKAIAAVMGKWEAAHAAREKAEAAFTAAQAAESDAVCAIVRAVGKGKFTWKGEKLTPMSRGDTAFLRAESSKNVRSLG